MSASSASCGEDGFVPSERTACIWDFFNSTPEMELNKNDSYDPSLDDPSSRDPSADMGVLYPNAKDIRFWHELYGRTEEEMNGRLIVSQTKDGPEFVSQVDSLEDDPVNSIIAPVAVLLPPSPAKTPNLLNPSPVPPSPSAGNASEILTAGLRGLWTSLPEIPQRTTGDNNPSPSPPPSLSLRPSGPLLRPSSPGSISSSQGRSRISNSADIFSNAGVRSVWGKLSSNATAAFSAVQDAYDGVAKDLKVLPRPSADNDETQAKISELQPRERLERSASRGTSQPFPVGSSYNPWDSIKPQKAIPALPSDNPWSTARSRTASSSRDLLDEEPLPLDPTVAHPPRRLESESLSGLRISEQNHGISVPYPTAVSGGSLVLEQEDKPPSADTDPLGVGFW